MNQCRILLAFLVLTIFLAGCQVKKQIPPPPAPEQELAVQADNAWKRAQFERSEQLYREMLDLGVQPLDREREAWERLVLSAVYTGDAERALAYLDQWRRSRPDAERTWEYHNAYVQTYLKLNQPGLAKSYLAERAADSALPSELRTRLARHLGVLSWQRGEYIDALEAFKTAFGLCPQTQCRLELEEEVSSRLSKLEPALLDIIATDVFISTDPEAFTSFPMLQLRWEQAISRLQEDPSTWNQVWQDLMSLLRDGSWTDRERVQQALFRLEKRYGHPRKGGIALLLPLSGPYAKVGWKILAGADLGRGELTRQGIDLNLQVINTDSLDWSLQLRALPPDYVVVGGPLQTDILQTAVGHEMHKKRAFFSFVPSLPNLEEGEDVWRFFGSPADQVRTLLDMSRGELGIHDYAVFYPDERFGLGMAKFFWEEAVQQGGRVTALKSYPPKENRAWARTVEQILTPSQEDRLESKEGAPRPDPDFQAVFLPDGLSNAQVIIPEFHFYDEDRLLFLGPELWTQSWEHARTERTYFQLSLMPASWWPESPSPGVAHLRELYSRERGGEPDLWVALGYDFIRFMGGIGTVPVNWSPQTLNRLLSGEHFFDWTMAPLRWNLGGIAAQDMVLLTPGRSGLVKADAQRVRQLMDAVKKRHDERIAARLEKLKPELVPSDVATEELTQ
ncbi:MAG: hypothetical protein ACLFTB_02770 [Desulfovibrionales bacterium]